MLSFFLRDCPFCYQGVYCEIHQISSKEIPFFPVVIVVVVVVLTVNQMYNQQQQKLEIIKHDGSQLYFHTIMHIIPAVKQTMRKVLTNFMTKKNLPCVCMCMSLKYKTSA